MASVLTVTRSWLIEAHKDNTGNVYVAGNAISASSGSGHKLAPGDGIEFSRETFELYDPWVDLQDVWWDSDTSGNKLVVSYELDLE